MTRRPYMPHAQKVSRASHLLTAPGKKWSESPTPRVGPARPPRQASTPASLSLPSNYAWLDDFSYSGGGRFAPSVDVIQWWDSIDGASIGAMIAVILVTQATATPPSGWTVTSSQTFNDFNYYLGVTNSNTNADTAEWTLDWSGVTGLGEWVYRTFSFWNPDTPVQGLVWDVKIESHPGSETGTWPIPTNASWIYSVPNMVTINCEYNYSTYHGPNAYDAYTYTYGTADTNSWIWTPVPLRSASLINQVSTYEIDAVDIDGNIWRPDYYYEAPGIAWGYPPNPSNACVLLGVKPG